MSLALNNPKEIRTRINIPDKNKPGYVVLDRMVSFIEFLEQIKRTLKTISNITGDLNAEDALENIYYPALPNTINLTIIPKGDYFVVPQINPNTGSSISFYFKASDTESIHILTLYYNLTNKDVWEISRILSEALHEGTFN